MNSEEQYKARSYQGGSIRIEHVGSRLRPAAIFDPYFYGLVNDKDVPTYVYMLPESMAARGVAAGGVVA